MRTRATGQAYLRRSPDLADYSDDGEGWMNEEGARIDMHHQHTAKLPLRPVLKHPWQTSNAGTNPPQASRHIALWQLFDVGTGAKILWRLCIRVIRLVLHTFHRGVEFQALIQHH